VDRWPQTWVASCCVFVVSELFTQQLELIESTDLELRFQIVEPQNTGRHLAYG